MPNWRSLFALQPGSRRWIDILRLCAPVLLPLVGFAIAGRFMDGALVGLGAYIVLFGAGQPARRRLLTYLAAAAGMLGAVAVGAATASSFWGAYLAYACVAVLAVSGSLLFDPGPPGAYFFVLMVGGGALLRGAGLGLSALVPMLALGNLLAVAFGMADLLWRGPDPASSQGDAIEAQPPIAYRLRELLTVPSAALLTLARVAIGILLAMLVTRWTGDPHPFWAVLVTVLVLSWPGEPAHLRDRALQRLAGTTVGILIFLLAANVSLAPPAYMAFLCVVFLAMARVADRNYAFASVFISLFALLLTVPLSAGEPPLAMAASRLADTAVAALIALALIRLLGPGLAGWCALASARRIASEAAGCLRTYSGTRVKQLQWAIARAGQDRRIAGVPGGPRDAEAFALEDGCARAGSTVLAMCAQQWRRSAQQVADDLEGPLRAVAALPLRASESELLSSRLRLDAAIRVVVVAGDARS